MVWISLLVLGVPGLVIAGLALYLVVLAAASLRFQPSLRTESKRSRLVVIVPAHDEEELVARCVGSLLEQSYPAELYRIAVVADNCSDATAERAAAAGAEVLERTDRAARGKGQALAWAIDTILARPDPPDGFVIVDADSFADPDLLASLESELSDGAQAVQGEYLILDAGRSSRSQLIAAGFLLFHRVRLGGRAVLGLPASLVGNGMLFSRQLLISHPWRAFGVVEDLEYTIDLRLAGVRPRFASTARVWGPLPSRRGAATSQRLRWEGGRWHVVRRRLGSLVATSIARRDPGLLDAALDLAVPPLGLLALATMAGTSASALAADLRLAPPSVLIPWLVAAASLTAFVVVGLVSAQAPASTYRALLTVPSFLFWKVGAYLKLLRGFDPRRWNRSERSPRLASMDAGRTAEIAGVRIDPVDMSGALDRLRCALGGRQLFQVATLNLDFLVRAQTNATVRDVFRRTHLNLPDGAPIVWLGRMLGYSIPARVAGADLVPLLLREAGRMGAPVFLLGGEGGVAALAAERLRSTCPDLIIAGHHEPPRAAIDEMDNEAILEQIAASNAKILLVALGHPKQDLWIDRYRDRLNVSIAIGVGCVLDLIAGRVTRAPVWMQRYGLEWLHRLWMEPRRLMGRYATDATWLAILSARILFGRLVRRERFAHG